MPLLVFASVVSNSGPRIISRSIPSRESSPGYCRSVAIHFRYKNLEFSCQDHDKIRKVSFFLKINLGTFFED